VREGGGGEGATADGLAQLSFCRAEMTDGRREGRRGTLWRNIFIHFLPFLPPSLPSSLPPWDPFYLGLRKEPPAF